MRYVRASVRRAARSATVQPLGNDRFRDALVEIQNTVRAVGSPNGTTRKIGRIADAAFV